METEHHNEMIKANHKLLLLKQASGFLWQGSQTLHSRSNFHHLFADTSPYFGTCWASLK